MDPTALHPRQAPRAGARLHPARDPGPGPADCHRQPPAGPLGRQSPGLPASLRADLRAGRRQGVRHVPSELEKRPSRPPVEGEPARLRLPEAGPDAGRWDHHSRCHGRTVAHLEQQAADCPAGAAADRHGDEVGHCPGLPDGQSGRGSARGRPAETRRHQTALQGTALWGSGRGGPDGVAIRGSRDSQARLRVSGPDGVPVGGRCAERVGRKSTWRQLRGRFRRNG